MKGTKPRCFGFPFVRRLRRNRIRAAEWQILLWRRQLERLHGTLVYTVYNRPSDYPDRIVVRVWASTPTGSFSMPSALLFRGIDDARSVLLSFGLYRMERHPSDDPVIIEVWV